MGYGSGCHNLRCEKLGGLFGKGKGAPAGDMPEAAPTTKPGEEPLHQKALTGAHSLLKNSLGQIPGGGMIADGVMNKVKDIVPGNNKKLGNGGGAPGGAGGGMGDMLSALAGGGGGAGGGGMAAMGNMMKMLGGGK